MPKKPMSKKELERVTLIMASMNEALEQKVLELQATVDALVAAQTPADPETPAEPTPEDPNAN